MFAWVKCINKMIYELQLIDGVDMRDYNIGVLRSLLSVVSQEPVLFDCSIHDNIVYGLQNDVPMADVIAAAKTANIHEFISNLPEVHRMLNSIKRKKNNIWFTFNIWFTVAERMRSEKRNIKLAVKKSKRKVFETLTLSAAISNNWYV